MNFVQSGDSFMYHQTPNWTKFISYCTLFLKGYSVIIPLIYKFTNVSIYKFTKG